MVQDWGQGMLMTGREYDEICQFDDFFGLRELRAKINGKVDDTEVKPPNRFSIAAEFNYGNHSVEIVRTYVDTTGLLEVVMTRIPKSGSTEAKAHRFLTLLACTTTLGCDIPKDALECEHETVFACNVYRHPLAIAQMKTALANYKVGEPYDFGNKTFIEVVMGPKIPVEGGVKYSDLGLIKLLEGKADGGWEIRLYDVPTDERLEFTPPSYPIDVCANCGSNGDDDDGQGLNLCTRCRDRRYCSVDCQKKHWKLHRAICTIPEGLMRVVMDRIPAGVKNDPKVVAEMKQFLDGFSTAEATGKLTADTVAEELEKLRVM